MNRIFVIALLAAALCTQAAARELIVINGLGETADRVDLDAATIDHNVATLGLTPNDFLVDGDLGVAINSGGNDLFFYELPTMSPAGSLWLGNNRNPWSGAWLGSDTLVITNWLTSTISLVDVSAPAVIGEYPIGLPAENINHPQSIVIVGRKAYITMSCFDDLYQYHPGKIEVFDLDANSTIARLGVNLNPQDITLGQDGYLYVVCTGNYWDVFGMMYRIDPTSDQLIDSLAVGGQPAAITTTVEGLAFLGAGGWTKSSAMPGWLNPNALNAASTDKGNGGLVYTVDLIAWQLRHGPTNPLHASSGVVNVATVSDSSVVVCCFQDDILVEIDSSGQVLSNYPTGDGPTAIGKYPACFVPRGDANGDGVGNITDAVYLVQYIFSSGPAPVNPVAGDANGDGTANITDAVFLVEYVFNDGEVPTGCSD
ncbi:MAG: dockerin type I repeat-containing protein [bacterium]